MYHEKLRLYFEQFIFTLKKHRDAIDFIYKHRIWEGFWKYGWVAKLLVVIGVIIGMKFLSVIFSWFTQADTSDPIAVISSVGSLMGQMAEEGYEFLFLGGMKYIMMIILEIVVFHVCRRTTAILTGQDSQASFDAFVKAQVRMIKVVIRCYIMEMIATILLKIFFGIFGFVDFLQPAFVFGVQCYYLGFVVMDNYFEQFSLSIKESVKYAQNFIGVALAIGLLLQGMFSIPIAGAIAGPFISAVAVTLVLFELSDLHKRPSMAPEPEEVV